MEQLTLDTALIEAILFLEGEPLDEAALSRISGLSGKKVKSAVENLTLRYAAEESTFELAHSGGGLIIWPKKAYWEQLRERYGRKNENRLSRAALETLTIIAYSQPITRAEVEAIRGVNVDNMIRLLIERKLIDKKGKKDVPGKPDQYGTTKDFLTLYGLGSIAELPKLDESEAERFELTGEQ